MQEFFFSVLMILSVATTGLSGTPTFNVLQYGAVGNGQANDSPVNQLSSLDILYSSNDYAAYIYMEH